MHARKLGVIAICGLAAAAGGGIWAMRAAERPAAPEPVALAKVREPQPEPSPPPEPLPEIRPRTRAPVEPPEALDESPPAPRPDAPREDAAEDDRRREYERMRAEAISRFDADGDGQLSDDERAAARAEWEARAEEFRQQMVRRYDTNGDGELSRDEREAARQEQREVRREIRDRVVPQYDLDGDGELNDAEREAARPAFEAEFQRLRAVAMIDRDGSRTVEAAELAQAIIGISDGDPAFDLNRDGVTDYRDATYATELAQGN